MFECLLEKMQELCQNDNALIMSKHLKFICPLSDTQVFVFEHLVFRFAHTSCLQCCHNCLHLYNAQRPHLSHSESDYLRKINGSMPT